MCSNPVYFLFNEITVIDKGTNILNDLVFVNVRCSYGNGSHAANLAAAVALSIHMRDPCLNVLE